IHSNPRLEIFKGVKFKNSPEFRTKVSLSLRRRPRASGIKPFACGSLFIPLPLGLTQDRLGVIP
ncbi:MAG: hypothetical protein NXH89_21020, partial [Cyclobacteriaceae bacterium]|nr:hypothetical protein [Cyclobacteriaceae bacterium]